jgi:pSer/pThr/pTyr-binding forkhead associated (FHA) protein
MERSFGKLILIQQGGPEQEYDLGKTSISLGRGMTNDIVLNDGRVSRSHARLDCSPSGCTIVDLGSANGTRLNGNRVDRAVVRPGDALSLGNSLFRFEVSQAYDEVESGMTVIDNDMQLDLSLDNEILPMSLNETGQPRLVVFHNEQTWEVPLEDTDQVTIGRTDESTLPLTIGNVSRHHAEVVRKGGIFILRDLGSTNGTWFKDQKVGEMVLQDGDVFRIGQALIVFKGGFGVEAMTLADESLSKKTERRPVVFVPGMMGSELWLGNERVWPNIKMLFKNPEILSYTSEVPLEARGIMQEVVIVPNLIKQDQYNRLGDYLVEDLGYERGVDFFEFAYDWRQDVRTSARELGQLMDKLPSGRPVTLVGHSLGTQVIRYYVERLGGKERAERLVLMGGPHQGVVKGLTSLLVAPQVLPFGLMGERLRQIIINFPSTYQIIPVYPCAVDQDGKQINFLEDESWVSEAQLPLLRLGKQFRRELGRHSSVSTISIYGYGIKTLSGVKLKRDATGKISDVTYTSQPSGDSTVLEKSAVMDGTEIHPVAQYHGSLFVDNDVKMRLKLELSRQFSNP